MSETIRSCPFCGGEARAFHCEASGMFDVQCQTCGAMPFVGSRRGGMTPEEVVAAWNRRAGDVPA